MRVLRTRVVDEGSPAGPARLRIEGPHLLADCGGGGRLEIVAAELAGQPFDATDFSAQFDTAVPLTE